MLKDFDFFFFFSLKMNDSTKIMEMTSSTFQDLLSFLDFLLCKFGIGKHNENWH